jgi:hypothetical protein
LCGQETVAAWRPELATLVRHGAANRGAGQG